MTRLIIVTGLSGSGKSVALHTLEDEGYYCIDNLPGSLLPDSIDRLLESGLHLYQQLAIGLDIRSERHDAHGLLALLTALRRRKNLNVEVLFLDTDRNTLVTRFSETRRRHPLSSKDTPLINAIDQEIRLLDGVKTSADLVIDTSTLTLHELRDMIRTYLLRKSSTSMSVLFQSFGFKHGTPASSDFMFDVRCLPNPHWEPELRAFTGQQEPIVEFLDAQQPVQDMFAHLRDFLTHWLPHFDAENRAYLTVSIGCTGGRHRSVYLAEKLASHFTGQRDNIAVRHRELALNVSSTGTLAARDPAR